MEMKATWILDYYESRKSMSLSIFGQTYLVFLVELFGVAVVTTRRTAVTTAQFAGPAICEFAPYD